MAFTSLRAIYKKEMLDMLRDRRTLISMIVVPIAAMPLLFLVIGKFVSSAEKRASEQSGAVAVVGAERLPGLLNALAGAGFKFEAKADPKAAVESKEIAAAVEVLDAGEVKQVKIYSDLSRPASEVAASRIRSALDRFKEDSVKLRLRELGVPEGLLQPFKIERVNIAPKQRMAGVFWGGMLGYIVVLLMFSGGMYPAIDVTAGEKERRTLEVLLASPASRQELILGKVLATTTAVAATAVLSVVSLVVSFRYANFGKASDKMDEMMGQLPLDPATAGLVILALIPTAIMAASLMIAIALFAKSFKEAQSYLTPLVMAVVFPLVVGMLPGIQLTPALALIPLFNICQLIKEIFQGEFSAATFAITLGANIVYAAVAFVAAVRIFQHEKVLFRT